MSLSLQDFSHLDHKQKPSAIKQSSPPPDYKKVKSVSINGFKASEDGWIFVIFGPAGYGHLYIDGGIVHDAHDYGSGEYSCCFLPIKKGSIVTVENGSTIHSARFYSAIKE